MKRVRHLVPLFAATAACMPPAAGCAEAPPRVQRCGMVIGVKKECIPEYKRLHANTWPGVIQATRECNIRNFSIYLKEIEPDRYLLFGYFEYTGRDMKADWAKMKTYPVMQEWWKHTDPMQTPLPVRGRGEWWATAEEVFHMD